METNKEGRQKQSKRHLKPAGMAAWVLAMAVITLSADEARADESSGDRGYDFGLAFTVGEGMYFIHDHTYRGPVSLEVVPSLGWSWFKLDLGLSSTLESIRIAGTHVGDWNFTFRPGGRLTPPFLPLYLRAAIPLEIHQHSFNWGVLFGLGADIKLFWIIGLVIEVDTTLQKNLSWGGDGVPLEFRAGLSFHN